MKLKGNSRLAVLGLPVLGLACFSLSDVLSPTAKADSLLKRCRADQVQLFEDSRARRPGDLLTIVINESTEVENRENKALNKVTAASGMFDLTGTTTTNSVAANLDASKRTDRSFAGDATYRNSREVLDRVTVTVISVMPNGNLILAGDRRITTAGETRVLRLSGIVRPVDIGPDNTVSSRFVANMQTVYMDDGAERQFTRQSWLGRAMNHVWPF
ncbi:MAG: flagellar basal body L-ring protein FlgH [Fuerstiella sp.]